MWFAYYVHALPISVTYKKNRVLIKFELCLKSSKKKKTLFSYLKQCSLCTAALWQQISSRLRVEKNTLL